MEQVTIAFTPTNWITVFLMAAGGFFILKGVLVGIKAIRSRGANA